MSDHGEADGTDMRVDRGLSLELWILISWLTCRVMALGVRQIFVESNAGADYTAISSLHLFGRSDLPK